MYRKFYKFLIIGDSQPAILHIPNRGDGEMGEWGMGRKVHWALDFY
jgi:hypothetical protein